MELQLGGKRKGIAIVSSNDYQMLSGYSWYLNEKGYVKGDVNGKKVRMHRLIMGATDEEEKVDHKNGIRHDNRRENLVVTDRFGNAQNQNIHADKESSSYFGVFFNKTSKKFVVECVINKIRYQMGSFINEIDAAEKFDLFIVHENLTHKRLNFPEKYEEYLKREYVRPKKTEKRQKSNPYIGVSKNGNKFVSRVTFNNKRVNILTSENPLECARAFDQFIVDNNIPNKKLNFPELHSDYIANFTIKTFCEDVDETTVKLLINNHLDKNILLDRDDYNKVKYYATHIREGYVIICIDDKSPKLSRFLEGVSDPKIFVDHKDSDPFNNKRCNLRISNVELNAHNRSKQEGTSSKFIGVTFDKSRNNWICSVRNKNTYVLRQRYDNEEYAVRHRDLFIMINLGDQHYKLNFPWDNEEEIEEWRDILGI